MPTAEISEGLFEVEPGAEGVRRSVAKGPVDKTFRAFTPGQDLLLPPSLDEWLPDEHMARFIADLVDEHLDLSRIHAAYTEGRGAPPFDPRLMVRVLLFGYTTGVRSSRKLEAAQTVANTGRAPDEFLADAGYCSADNLDQAAGVSADTGTEFFIATGRSKHDDPLPASPRGRIPRHATPRDRMARKLTTKKGRAAYSRRKVIVEPVFGQMGTLQNGKQLLLRGLDGAKGGWLLLAACHNLRKLHRHVGISGLAELAAT